MSVLVLENLVKRYSGKTIVNSVCLNVESGRVAGLLGPNGAGKTTTFYMAVGLIRPDQGRVLVDDDDLTEAPMHVRARMGVGYLPQESSVFRKLTALQNILVILELRPMSAKARMERAMELLSELTIAHLAGERADVLSGGERRRLEIARALASEPKFLLLDEPFAGIDPLAVDEIQGIIRSLASKGIGILISDHNVQDTLKVCDEAAILAEGRVIEFGTPRHIATSPIAMRIYLGEDFRLT